MSTLSTYDGVPVLILMVFGVELALCSSSGLELSAASERFSFSVTTPSLTSEGELLPPWVIAPDEPPALELPEKDEGEEVFGEALKRDAVEEALAPADDGWEIPWDIELILVPDAEELGVEDTDESFDCGKLAPPSSRASSLVYFSCCEAAFSDK